LDLSGSVGELLLVLPVLLLVLLPMPLFLLIPLLLPGAGVVALVEVLVDGLFGRSQATSPIVASRVAIRIDDDFMICFSR
jgi:hypothetical protein